jgi:hypothetical protein
MSLSLWYSLTVIENGFTCFDGVLKCSGTSDPQTIVGCYQNGNYSVNLLQPIGTRGCDNQLVGQQVTQAGMFTNCAQFTLNDQPYNQLNIKMVDYGNNTTAIQTWFYYNGSTNNMSIGISTITPVSAPSCYNIGTRIKTPHGFIPIELLKVQDEVCTTNCGGMKKIVRIGNNTMINTPQYFNLCMYKHKHSNLIVTGGHSLLVDPNDVSDECKEKNIQLFNNVVPENIDGKMYLLAAASPDFEQLTEIQKYTYYHLVLEPDATTGQERYVIWVENDNLYSETVTVKQFESSQYIE